MLKLELITASLRNISKDFMSSAHQFFLTYVDSENVSKLLFPKKTKQNKIWLIGFYFSFKIIWKGKLCHKLHLLCFYHAEWCEYLVTEKR